MQTLEFTRALNLIVIPLGDEATIDQRQLLTEMRNTKLLSNGTAV